MNHQQLADLDHAIGLLDEAYSLLVHIPDTSHAARYIDVALGELEWVEEDTRRTMSLEDAPEEENK